MLAWVRTGLAVMGVGFVLNRHGGTADPVLAGLGLALVATGAVGTGLAAWQYHRYYRALGPGTRLQRDLAAWAVWFAVVVALIGGGVAASLAVHPAPPSTALPIVPGPTPPR